MKSILITNATIINENSRKISDIYINNGRIEQISKNLSHIQADIVIDATDKYVIPGMIDDQVHFREPGLTDKADIRSESLAGVIGGTTTYMDMPNNKPPIVTNEGLDKKFQVAENRSFANYSFYLGTTNDNIEEIKKTSKRACGVKIFMGASTGNMLVDNIKSLENIFLHCPKLIATHCESSPIIDKNFEAAKEKYGDALENLLSSYERSPDDPNTLNYLGYTSRKLDDFKNAELYYLMGLKIEPNHSGINEYLGELYVITKRLDKAKERLKVLEGCKCEEYNELKNVINTGSSKY